MTTGRPKKQRKDFGVKLVTQKGQNAVSAFQDNGWADLNLSIDEIGERASMALKQNSREIQEVFIQDQKAAQGRKKGALGRNKTFAPQVTDPSNPAFIWKSKYKKGYKKRSGQDVLIASNPNNAYWIYNAWRVNGVKKRGATSVARGYVLKDHPGRPAVMLSAAAGRKISLIVLNYIMDGKK